MTGGWPDPTGFDSLVDIIDSAADRVGDTVLMGLATDAGLAQQWSAREFRTRSLAAAWRLRAVGLAPGDRLLTLAPPGPDLAAVLFGALRAGVVLVPADLAMTPEVIARIGERAEARHLAIGTGRDAPDTAKHPITSLPTTTVEELVAPLAEPSGWQAEVEAWPRPTRSDLFEIVYTSGTTGVPKGVTLSHGNVLASLEAIDRIIPQRQHRIVSLLPLSHLFGQIELFYVLIAGAPVVYLRSRTPRVIFEAIREHQVTTMVGVPNLLELFWKGLMREVERQGQLERFERARRLARHLPYPLRRLLFRRVHERLGGRFTLFFCSAAFLPPAVQLAWEDLGIVVIQGYGATECGFATANTLDDHEPGQVGRQVPPSKVRLAPSESEIEVGGPNVFQGYWRDDAATAAAKTDDGWYRTGDVGRWDPKDRLVLSGRTKNMIVLPNGFNIYPEDIENELRVAGLGETVVVETVPGRIEAVVLASAGDGAGASETADPDGSREARLDAGVKAANRSLGAHQRVDAWRLWPDRDFPRTHTLKIRRDLVRAWARGDGSSQPGDAP